MSTANRDHLLDSQHVKQQPSDRLRLMRKCGLEIEAELFMNTSVAEQIGTELLPSNPSAGNTLDWSAHLGWESVDLVYPAPNVCLLDRLTSLLRQQSSKGSLPLDNTHGLLNRFHMGAHERKYDRDNCLMQPAHLLLGDRLTGRGYRMSMAVKQKEVESAPRDLADRLAWTMEKAGMDDKAVAKALGPLVGKKVAWQTIQGIRLGTSKTSTYLAQIAQVIKCNSGWLATGRGQPYDQPVTVTPTGDMTPGALAMARRWQSLPPNLQSTLYIVLTAFEKISQDDE